MKSFFTLFTSKNKGKMKWNMVHHAMGIFLSAVMIFHMFQAGVVNIYAVEETIELQNDLDFSGGVSDSGNLDTDGYHWNSAGKTLELKNVNIRGTVILADETVEIKTEGLCSINALSIAGDSPQNTKLSFSGMGELTIQNQLNISGGNNNAITVETGAKVIAKGGITIGASGGLDSIITVKGTLDSEGTQFTEDGVTYYSCAIYAGKVVVGSGGRLNVSGHKGVLLNGMGGNGIDIDFADVFTVQKNGCFTANCVEYNVMVASINSIPDDANQVFVIPENYLPAGCDIKKSNTEKEINFVRKGTEEVYTGPMTIHERHDWSEDWNKDESSHWKECKFDGCGKRNDEGPHSFDSDTWTCICGSRLDVAWKVTEELVYNGQMQKPDVTVRVDDTELDVSKYDTVYSNNINAGEASVTITGKDGLTFERTLEFKIERATPTITWGSSSQSVIYNGGNAIIDKPIVKLAGGEEFNGEINYFYRDNGSDMESSSDYTPGLPVNSGEYSVRASIKGPDNYTDAESTDLALTVEKAENAPNMPADIMYVERACEKVSFVKLPEKWQWQETDLDNTLTSEVSNTAVAVYVGEDKGNYKNETVGVTIIRADCNHANTEVRNVVAATCQNQGYSGDTYCLDCGILLESGTQTALAAHIGGIANCVSGKICTVCGTEYTERDSGVHVNTELQGEKNASCTENGYTGDTCCTGCHTIISSGAVLPATGHEWEVTGEEGATTTSEGKRIYTCDKCGATYEEAIPKLPEEEHKHEYNVTVVKEASCTETGEKKYVCSCGDSYMESIPAYGHSYLGEVTTQPTVFAEGVMTYTCSRCKDTYTESIDRLKDTLSRPDKPEESEEPPVTNNSDRAQEQSTPGVAMNESAIVSGESIRIADKDESPLTGQPRTPWWNIMFGALAIIVVSGGFSLAKRKKGEGGI